MNDVTTDKSQITLAISQPFPLGKHHMQGVPTTKDNVFVIAFVI